MALNPVSLDERLRPWYLAGVTCFLLPDDIAAEMDQDIASPLPDRRQPHLSSQDSGPQHTASNDTVKSPASKAAKQGRAANQTRPDSRHVAYENWPEHWQRRFKATPKAPVVWTYPELGEDLSGQGDKARASCLRELIGTLGLPKGSSAFWPLSLPPLPSATKEKDPVAQNQASAQSPYFRAGLALLDPKALILFGNDSITATGLGLALAGTFTQTVVQGRLYIALPDFLSLSGNKNIFVKTSIYLRSSLSKLPGILK